MPFILPTLPYSYNALEPHIDVKTMEIHHTKHHQTYINKLNEAIAKHPELESWTLEDLVKNFGDTPEDIRTAIRNHGGGHYNHSLFWESLTTDYKAPENGFMVKLNESFGGFDSFKEKFTASALGLFGSGWTWLVKNSVNNLSIINTPNQDNPLSQGTVPLLGLDLWEHAYYLNYQNKRPDYITAWWNIVNWEVVAERFRDLQT